MKKLFFRIFGKKYVKFSRGYNIYKVDIKKNTISKYFSYFGFNKIVSSKKIIEILCEDLKLTNSVYYHNTNLDEFRTCCEKILKNAKMKYETKLNEVVEVRKLRFSSCDEE